MRPYTLLTSQFQQPTNKQDKQGQGLNKVVTCAGNLANHIANWREITTDQWILEAVSGYRLQLASQPYQLLTPSPINFSDSESAVVQSEIQTLLDKGAIEHVEYTQGEFICTLFLVPKKSGDLRPVISLKPLNFFVEKIHFKMENIDSTINYVSTGDYMVSLDLKDAYFSVPIHPLDRKLLRFFWKGIAHVAGLIVSALPAVRYLQLHYRSIEFCKSQALLAGRDFDDHSCLDFNSRFDLLWIIQNIATFNGKVFQELEINLFVNSDASLTGWGASCNGQSTGGRWSLSESNNHINFLELLAAFLALQSFVIQSNIHVRRKFDNTTAVSYINNMGRIRSEPLNTLAKEIWQWCRSREI